MKYLSLIKYNTIPIKISTIRIYIPSFVSNDNPGGWSEFIYRPYNKIVKKGEGSKYQYHRLPSGMTPVPGKGTIRKYGDYNVHYRGTFNLDPEKDKGLYQKYVTTTNPFLSEREGSLDAQKLKQFGMTPEQMNDPFFFYQL